MTRLVGIALYLARQDGAFRGHDESITSLNKENFLELVQWLRQIWFYPQKAPWHIQSQQKKKHRCRCCPIRHRMTLSRPLPPMSEGHSQRNRWVKVILHSLGWHQCFQCRKGVLRCSLCPSDGNQGDILTSLRCDRNNRKGIGECCKDTPWGEWTEIGRCQGPRLRWSCKYEWKLQGSAVAKSEP